MTHTTRKAVYFFCQTQHTDPVAGHVFAALTRLFPLQESELRVDGYPVLFVVDDAGNAFHFVRTGEVLSHDYPAYLPLLNDRFASFDLAGVVNWHEGANAPDNIFSVHTTGDVVSGIFGAADPRLTTQLLLHIETHRQQLGLDDFRTVTEATHWSGIPAGTRAELLAQYPVPLVDIEIGSSMTSWSNPRAAEVLARALLDVFNPDQADRRSLLCIGGIHFEPAFTRAVLEAAQGQRVAVSHILPNHWLVHGEYNTEIGVAKLHACITSIIGTVDALVFHDSLKSAYKAQVLQLAQSLQIPAFKHKGLSALR